MNDVDLYEVVNEYLRDTYPDDDKVALSVDILFVSALLYGEDELDTFVSDFDRIGIEASFGIRWFDVIKRAADVAEALESDRLAVIVFDASIKFSALYR